MTTDITELAQSLRRRAASANEFGESLYVKADDVLALVEALEKAQQRIAELEEAEQKLCAANVTLDARAELAERQLAELESRTVKLPEPYAYLRENDGQIQISIGAERPSDRSGGYATPWFPIYTAAGIRWEAE